MEPEAPKNNFLKMPRTKTFLVVLCGALVVLIAYGLGILVGYRRAIFASQFGEHYYRTMYGDPFGKPMIGVMGMGPMTMHGVAGQVIDVASETISVKDINGNEESVWVVSGTPIRDMNNSVSMQEIQPADQIIVIGQPDPDGDIAARFIRIFETSSSSND
jgi:hypothetical protein